MLKKTVGGGGNEGGCRTPYPIEPYSFSTENSGTICLAVFEIIADIHPITLVHSMRTLHFVC